MLLRKVSPHLILVTSLRDCGDISHGEIRGRSFKAIACGESSGITEEGYEVIRDQVAWNGFWKAHAGPDSPVPIVNFSKEMVLAVHLGRRNGAGYGVNVTKIENQMGELVVYYDKLKPGPHCVVAMVVPQPLPDWQSIENETLLI